MTLGSKSYYTDKMIKNQQGVVPLVVILGLTFAITLLGSSYLFTNQNLPTQSAPLSYATEKDFDNISDTLLKKHFVNQINQSQYRIKTTSLGKPGFTLLDVIVRDETVWYHSLENDGKKDVSELVSIGDTLFVKDYSDNKWWKQKLPRSNENNTNDIPESFREELLKKQQIVSYDNLESDTCNKIPCYKYEEINPHDENTKRLFWFDSQLLLLQKEEVIFGEFKTTNNYSYENILVEIPQNTKEVLGNKNIYDFYSKIGGIFKPSDSDVKKLQQELKSQEDLASQDSKVLDLEPQ